MGEASKNRRILQVIQHEKESFAIKMQTTNTEVYSGFNAVDLFTYVRQGSLTLFNTKDTITIPEGSCFIIPKYADFKVQRHLNAKGDPFESYGIVLPDLGFASETYSDNKSIQKSPIEHLLIPTASVELITKRLITHFKLKRLFVDQEVREMIIHLSEFISQLPEAVLISNLSSRHDAFLGVLHAHITENINQEALAKKMGMSVSSFFRLARKKLGISPYKWLQDQRIHYARFQLQYTALPVSKIYMDLGYEDLAHFSKAFKTKFGYNPSDMYDTVTIEIIS